MSRPSLRRPTVCAVWSLPLCLFVGCQASSDAASPQDVPTAIDIGLRWLVTHQDQDGRFDCDGFMKHDRQGEPCNGPGNGVHDVGVTGLALMALLRGGSTPTSGPHQDHVRRAAQWLIEQQEPNGLIGGNRSSDFIYDHSIATAALCMMQQGDGHPAARVATQKALDYLESHRNPYAVWRYQPRDNDNDTSVTGWALLACSLGKQAGLNVSENALKLGATWLDQVTGDDGRAGYTKAGEPSSRHPGLHGQRFPVERGEAMTAVALHLRSRLGQDASSKPVMKKGAARLLEKPPDWDPKAGTIDAYYWYHGTEAMAAMGGSSWQTWRDRLTAELVPAQRRDGNFEGSFDPIEVWGEDGGRIYATALAVLSMQVAATAKG